MEDSQKRLGFSPIEIFVVVAIIVILASITVAVLNTARLKSRDSRRVRDLHQIANVVALREENSTPVIFTGCTRAGAAVHTCTGPGPDISAFRDPSRSSIVCTTGSTAPCEYVVYVQTGNTYPATSHNWKVCAYLEYGAPPVHPTPGLIHVETGGTVSSGC